MNFYNEIFDANGKAKPHYAGVMKHWNTIRSKERKSLYSQSQKLFSGDFRQHPLPRVLTQSEFLFLKKGVDQRARAIRAFLHDYCSQGKQWYRIIPKNTLNTIIMRHHESNTLSKLKPHQIAFPYGPDIIRNQHGKWRVVEDSAGFIGGIGDILQGHRILHKLVPKFRYEWTTSASGIHDPEDFFANLAAHFVKKAKKNKGIPLLYLRPHSYEADQETRRLAQAFAKFGIESTTSSNHLKNLEITLDGVFLRKSGSRERVGALISHAGPEQLDRSRQRSSFKKFQMARASENYSVQAKNLLNVLNAPSLENAILGGQVWSNFSPGMLFINDKIFGLYVDSMIRRLLKETPILESIPAIPTAIYNRSQTWELNRTILKELQRDKNRFVVKQVDRDGGDGVWIGEKESGESLKLILKKIKAAPKEYIIQKFEHLSVLENRIVDLRLHAHIDAEKIIVSNTPWGRANWIHGNGKVNISGNGFMSPVVVLKQ